MSKKRSYVACGVLLVVSLLVVLAVIVPPAQGDNGDSSYSDAGKLYLPFVANRSLWFTGWVVGQGDSGHGVDGYGVIIHTTDSGETWVRQGAVGEIPDADLHGVAAIDAQYAWVTGGQGTILLTRNGGRSWELQEVPDEVSDAGLNAVYAIDRKTAWVVGGREEGSVILHTTDGGQTWTRQGQDLPLEVPLNGVYASDAEHAWAVGEEESGKELGTIVRTTDGGITWERVPYTKNPANTCIGCWLISVHGVDANTVWAVGNGQTIHTEDGGATWVDQTPGAGIADHNGVYVVDRNTVWVVTDFGGIYRSDDGGANWVKQSPPHVATNDWILRISAVDKETAWATTEPSDLRYPAHVLHTADGGHTWVAQTIPVDALFWGVSFVR